MWSVSWPGRIQPTTCAGLLIYGNLLYARGPYESPLPVSWFVLLYPSLGGSFPRRVALSTHDVIAFIPHPPLLLSSPGQALRDGHRRGVFRGQWGHQRHHWHHAVAIIHTSVCVARGIRESESECWALRTRGAGEQHDLREPEQPGAHACGDAYADHCELPHHAAAQSILEQVDAAFEAAQAE